MNTQNKTPVSRCPAGDTSKNILQKKILVDTTPDTFLPAIKNLCIFHLSRWFFDDRADLVVKLVLFIWTRFGGKLVSA